MKARLAAVAAGAVLIATACIAFSLGSQPIIAGQSAVEPVRPSIYLATGSEQCQVVSRLPRGADRLRLVIAWVHGGARDLRVRISDERGGLSAADLKHPKPGPVQLKLRPSTRAAHGASLCFSNPGPGEVVLGGHIKRNPGTVKGKTVEKRLIASAIFLRPGSSSRFAETGAIVDRYANSQTGVTGRWTLWLAVLSVVAAVLIALWAVVALPGRRD
jgi:hypothetical protein